jgi:flavin reductase (DIM6/NTAB) family NADH-FMN oxidoreductase RutF
MNCRVGGSDMFIEAPSPRYVMRILHPKVAALLTSIGRDGKANVAAFAWVTPVSADPPLVAVSCAPRRYTYKLLKETGEFVINIPASNMLNQVWICGSKSGREVDKFKTAKLTVKPASRVKAPIIEECIGYMECKVVNELESGDHVLFIGKVLAAGVKKGYFTDKWEVDKVNLLLHLGGPHFTMSGKYAKAE